MRMRNKKASWEHIWCCCWVSMARIHRLGVLKKRRDIKGRDELRLKISFDVIHARLDSSRATNSSIFTRWKAHSTEDYTIAGSQTTRRFRDDEQRLSRTIRLFFIAMLSHERNISNLYFSYPFSNLCQKCFRDSRRIHSQQWKWIADTLHQPFVKLRYGIPFGFLLYLSIGLLLLITFIELLSDAYQRIWLYWVVVNQV